MHSRAAFQSTITVTVHTLFTPNYFFIESSSYEFFTPGSRTPEDVKYAYRNLLKKKIISAPVDPGENIFFFKYRRKMPAFRLCKRRMQKVQISRAI